MSTNIECEKCKKKLHVTETTNQAKRIPDSAAWFCDSCLMVHCTTCTFSPFSDQAVSLLAEVQCPFCGSTQIHIASQKNIEEWDYFRPKKNNKTNKNTGCVVFLGIIGIIITGILLI